MWSKFKSFSKGKKIFFGILAFILFPVTIAIFLGEASINLLIGGFKKKKILKIVGGLFVAYFFIVVIVADIEIYSSLFKGELQNAEPVANENEGQIKKVKEEKTDEIKMSEDEQKISKVIDTEPKKIKNIANILKECGIEDFDSIKHDDGLDNAHFDGEKGYRIEFSGSKNIILYINKDNSVYNVRWANNDFYKDSKVVSKVSDYTLTIDEKTELQLQCENGVSAVLKSPSTAKFPNITEWAFSKDKEKIVVQSYVDSQNSLGAMLRSDFQITFTSDSKNVKSFIFDGEEMIK
ncbi:hypothetical protein ACYZFO_10720 [Clostridioides difficile]